MYLCADFCVKGGYSVSTHPPGQPRRSSLSHLDLLPFLLLHARVSEGVWRREPDWGGAGAKASSRNPFPLPHLEVSAKGRHQNPLHMCYVGHLRPYPFSSAADCVAFQFDTDAGTRAFYPILRLTHVVALPSLLNASKLRPAPPPPSPTTTLARLPQWLPIVCSTTFRLCLSVLHSFFSCILCASVCTACFSLAWFGAGCALSCSPFLLL